MPEELQVPDSLQMTFKRMLHSLPADRRKDIDLQKSILLFLKLGGERLARARIKLAASPFPKNFSVVKLRPQPIADDPVKETEADPKTQAEDATAEDDA